MVAESLRNCTVYLAQLLNHRIRTRHICLDYIAILEQLTGATTVDSDFTAEYKETDNLLTGYTETEVTV